MTCYVRGDRRPFERDADVFFLALQVSEYALVLRRLSSFSSSFSSISKSVVEATTALETTSHKNFPI